MIIITTDQYVFVSNLGFFLSKQCIINIMTFWKGKGVKTTIK